MKQLYLIVLGIGIVFSAFSQTQKKTESSSQKSDSWKSGTFNGLKFRSIGPAVTSGRVVDFAVNPANSKTYFVAAACGGVWKSVHSDSGRSESESVG
jgi:hypothetical protein